MAIDRRTDLTSRTAKREPRPWVRFRNPVLTKDMAIQVMRLIAQRGDHDTKNDVARAR